MIPTLWRDRISRGVSPSPPSEMGTLTLEAQHDLSPFADDYEGESRYALCAVRYDNERHEFVATDSRIMAVAPANSLDTPLPESVMIPASALRGVGIHMQERGERFRGTLVVDGDELRIDAESESVNCKQVGGRFPIYKTVINSAISENPLASVTLDPRLLMKICEHAARAYASSAIAPAIRLSLLPKEDAGNERPVLIELLNPSGEGAADVTYYLMPLLL